MKKYADNIFVSFLSKIFRKIESLLGGGTIFRGIALIVGGTASAQILSLVTTPFITRLYTPEDFGVLSVFQSIMSILAPMATLRYSTAIPIVKTNRFANELLKLCIIISVLLSLVFFVCLFLFGSFLEGFFPDGSNTIYIWLMPLCFMGMGIYQTFLNWILRKKKYGLIANTKLIQSVSSVSIKILWGIIYSNPLGLLFGFMATHIAGLGSLYSAIKKENHNFFFPIKKERIFFAAKRYIRFPLIQGWSQLLLSFGAHLPVLLLTKMFSTSIVGLYGFAFYILNMPMNLIANSTAQVFYAEIASIGTSKPERIYQLTLKLIKKLALVTLPVITIIAIFAPTGFNIVFGEKWMEAGIYARYLSIYVFVGLFSMPVMSSLNLFEKQFLQLVLNFIRIVAVIAVFLVCHLLKVPPRPTIILYSIVASAVRLFTVVFLIWFLKNEVKKRDKNV